MVNRTWTLRLAASVALACVARATAEVQTPSFPKALAPIEGRVLDEELRPVDGALVQLVAGTDPGREFGRSIAQVLRRTPLPEAKSQDDGSFVLALTTTQQSMYVVEHPSFQPDANQFWLVVRKEGYSPWREPLGHGLATFLGARVVLRKRRDEDPFEHMPWPPVAFELTYPWAPLPATPSPADGSRRGVRPDFDAAANTARTRISVRLPKGEPAARARVMFGNSCYGSPDDELPLRLDSNGVVELATPAGEHQCAILADGCMPRFQQWTAPGGDRRAEVEIDLQRADVVDIVAMDDDGGFVPFVGVDVVPFDHDRDDRPSMSVRTDSLGRVRVWVPDRTAYFAYGDEGRPAERVPFGEAGVVRVSKRRLVTVAIRADDLPRRGLIRRQGPAGEVFQGFPAGRSVEGPKVSGEWIATRAFARGLATVTIGGSGKAPVIIRSTDLPGRAAEPILDLAVLDRRLRKRADLDLRSTDGRRIVRFAIRPDWQIGARDRSEAIRFSKRGPAPARAWEFWARDDAAYVATAEAVGLLSTSVTVPAHVPGAPTPTIMVELPPTDRRRSRAPR